MEFNIKNFSSYDENDSIKKIVNGIDNDVINEKAVKLIELLNTNLVIK